tara:strand:- start:1965 stop:2609 length:645 start_codon:yes stop_codon:yes gene_type:complete
MRKIGITGHTSGVGKEIYDHCMFKGYDVTGYSRATGFNMVYNEANEIINDILRKDIDIVFNNAWYPRLQCKIMKVLHEQWKDRDGKYIINTGSASIYQPNLTGEVYEHDKRELRDYSIEAAQLWPSRNKCRMFTVSLGWTNTAMVGEGHPSFLDPYEAALIIVNLMEEQKYVIPEIIVANKQVPLEELDEIRAKAQSIVVESITESNRLVNANR